MTPPDDDAPAKEEGSIPLPEGAIVRPLGPDLALIEMPIPEARLPVALTEAEQDIAAAVFQGATNQEIATARGVNIKTVAKQLEAIYRKLRVSSRVELVLRLRGNPRHRD